MHARHFPLRCLALLCGALVGGSGFAAAGSAIGAIGATPAAATLSLSSSIASGVAPAAITLTATIAGDNLTGSILFRDGAATLGSATINKSKAVLSATLGSGIHRLSAVYQGGATQLASAIVSVVVDNSPECR